MSLSLGRFAILEAFWIIARVQGSKRLKLKYYGPEVSKTVSSHLKENYET
jgi:hypothetical protein